MQSTNDSGIPFRMLEYLVAVTRVHRRIPKQILLYVGRKPLQMPSQFEWPDGVTRYTLIDMREFDAEPLIASPEPSDNVLGILGRLRDQRAALRSILERLSGLPGEESEFYFRALLIAVGLRGLEDLVREEVKKMSLAIDLSENKILGPAYRRGLEQGLQDGRQAGLQEGRQEGRQEGQLDLLRRQIERRFGPLPSWAAQSLSQRSAQDLEQVGVRVFDAATLEDLLR